jgi:hypothetical protein
MCVSPSFVRPAPIRHRGALSFRTLEFFAARFDPPSMQRPLTPRTHRGARPRCLVGVLFPLPPFSPIAMLLHSRRLPAGAAAHAAAHAGSASPQANAGEPVSTPLHTTVDHRLPVDPSQLQYIRARVYKPSSAAGPVGSVALVAAGTLPPLAPAVVTVRRAVAAAAAATVRTAA